MHSPEMENPGAVAASGLQKNDHSSGGLIDRTNATAAVAPQPKSAWRDRLPVHPAADLFPLLSPDELKKLAKDIDENGLVVGVDLYMDMGKKTYVLIDGRNRLDALELLGRKDIFDSKGEVSRHYRRIRTDLGAKPDIAAHVVSLNIHRRHLTSEQKRGLIAKLLKLDPTKSNRSIGEMAKADHHKVAGERAKLEATGEISPVEITKGKDGKSRPAKANPKPTAAAPAMIPFPKAPGANERPKPLSPAQRAGISPLASAAPSPEAMSSTPSSSDAIPSFLDRRPPDAMAKHAANKASQKDITDAILKVVDSFSGVSPFVVISAFNDAREIIKARADKAVQQ